MSSMALTPAARRPSNVTDPAERADVEARLERLRAHLGAADVRDPERTDPDPAPSDRIVDRELVADAITRIRTLETIVSAREERHA